jgi:hypothetical protein
MAWNRTATEKQSKAEHGHYGVTLPQVKCEKCGKEDRRMKYPGVYFKLCFDCMQRYVWHPATTKAARTRRRRQHR